LLKPWGHWQGLPSGYEGLAHTRRALGDWEGAFEAVDELIAFCGTPQAPPLLPVAQALRATLWVAQGELDAATQWLASSGLGPEDPLNYLQEPLYLCLARVLLALGRLDDAARLLAHLLVEAETGERHGRAIEILVLQALTLEAQGERADAQQALKRALTLAEPEGYVRAFVDGGATMAALLSQVEVLPAYVERLLAALGEALRDDERAESPVAHPPVSPLIEPLSERELELLRLIAAGLTNQAIAGQLVVSVNTVKTHARNIYGKLGVRNRTQAAARARELGLI
jgi:LuxR family maltose regulon positive regulatory protein